MRRRLLLLLPCLTGGCGQLLNLDHYDAGQGGAAGAPVEEHGKVLWAKAYGAGGAQLPRALAASDDGAVVFAGELEGQLELDCCAIVSASAFDPFLAAVDVGGVGLWGQVWEASAAASIDSFWQAGASVWFAGTFDADLSLAGTMLASQDADAFIGSLAARDGAVLDAKGIVATDPQRRAQVAVDAFQRLAIAGETSGPTDTDVLVRTFHDNGATRWEKTFGSSAPEEVHAVAVDPAGHVVVAGSNRGTVDFGCQPHAGADGDGFVVKLDYSTGACLWSLAVGGPGAQQVKSLALDAAGDAVIAGDFDGALEFDGASIGAEQGSLDAFVMRLDVDGKIVWWRTSQAVGDESVAQAVFTPSGAIAVTGEFTKALGFDDRTALQDTRGDGFVLLLEGDGTLRWSVQLRGGERQRGVAVASHGERVFVLAELHGRTHVGDWFLEHAGMQPSIALAAFLE